MHTYRCICPPFLGFVYTAIAGLLSQETQSNEGSKYFTGRIKNHSPLLTTQLRLMESYYFVSAIPVFLYIWTLFQVFFLLLLFLLFKFPKS